MLFLICAYGRRRAMGLHAAWREQHQEQRRFYLDMKINDTRKRTARSAKERKEELQREKDQDHNQEEQRRQRRQPATATAKQRTTTRIKKTATIITATENHRNNGKEANPKRIRFKEWKRKDGSNGAASISRRVQAPIISAQRSDDGNVFLGLRTVGWAPLGSLNQILVCPFPQHSVGSAY